MSLQDEFAADIIEILDEQGQTCSIGALTGIPCAFSSTGELMLNLFMEQDVQAAKLICAIADLTAGIPSPETTLTAPDGKTYRIKSVNADGYGATVLFTLTDLTGKV